MLASGPVRAEGDDGRFAALQAGTESVPSLATFVERYVGACPATAEPDCQAQARAFREQAKGKRYSLLVVEGSSAALSMGPVRGDVATVNLTPFFPAGPSGLSQGAPLKLDASGNPVFPLVPLDFTPPDGQSTAMIARQVQAQAFRLQVVFTVDGLWTLPRKGNPAGPLQGVKARFEGLQVQVGRTGQVVANWFPRR